MRATRVEEETEYDKTGQVTKKEVKEYTFFYLNGDEISTLVKKDGKPLSEEEQKKENEKTRETHRRGAERSEEARRERTKSQRRGQGKKGR